MSQRKTYDVLAAAFAQEGVQNCFTLMGDANMNWATRLSESGVRMIYVRHEHCAVAAATAEARKRNDVGVATVTCGPGLTQVITALPAAVRANIPLVVFAGEAPLKLSWYNQEIDQGPLITGTGAAYHQLHHVESMPKRIRDAFLQARVERRPVVLGVPFDLQDLTWTGDDALPEPSRNLVPNVAPMAANADDIARAAEQVAKAKRIVIMAGMGAVQSPGAAEACQALAERCDALVATTLPARGQFANDPFSLNVVGGFSSEIARECLAEADLIIAVGTILAHHNAAGGKLFPNAHVLQIDTKPLTVSQGRVAADSHVRADARLGVEALCAAIPARSPDWRSAEMARRIKDTPIDKAEFAKEPDCHDPRDVAAALEAAVPADWQLVNSSGHCSFYVAHMPSRPQENFLTIREFGAIGNGISYAMGVAAAHPDTPVVLFDGDGSLLMHVQELETIRRHKLNILICVMNDGAYGSEIHKLRAEGMSDQGAVFGRTDLASIAQGFGLGGHRVTDLAELPRLIEEFSGTSGAAVFDFPISDQVVSPVIRAAHPPRKH